MTKISNADVAFYEGLIEAIDAIMEHGKTFGDQPYHYMMYHELIDLTSDDALHTLRFYCNKAGYKYFNDSLGQINFSDRDAKALKLEFERLINKEERTERRFRRTNIVAWFGAIGSLISGAVAVVALVRTFI